MAVQQVPLIHPTYETPGFLIGWMYALQQGPQPSLGLKCPSLRLMAMSPGHATSSLGYVRCSLESVSAVGRTQLILFQCPFILPLQSVPWNKFVPHVVWASPRAISSLPWTPIINELGDSGISLMIWPRGLTFANYLLQFLYMYTLWSPSKFLILESPHALISYPRQACEPFFL